MQRGSSRRRLLLSRSLLNRLFWEKVMELWAGGHFEGLGLRGRRGTSSEGGTRREGTSLTPLSRGLVAPSHPVTFSSMDPFLCLDFSF